MERVWKVYGFFGTHEPLKDRFIGYTQKSIEQALRDKLNAKQPTNPELMEWFKVVRDAGYEVKVRLLEDGLATEAEAKRSKEFKILKTKSKQFVFNLQPKQFFPHVHQPVLQFSKEGYPLRRYNSLEEAYETTRIPLITQLCNAQQPDETGCRWKHAELTKLEILIRGLREFEKQIVLNLPFLVKKPQTEKSKQRINNLDKVSDFLGVVDYQTASLHDDLFFADLVF